jgi:hypothetical protein
VSTERPSAIEIGMPVAISASSMANKSRARDVCDSSMMSKRASAQMSASTTGVRTISQALTSPARDRVGSVCVSPLIVPARRQVPAS